MGSSSVELRSVASDRWPRSHPRTKGTAAARGQSACRPSRWDGS